MSDAASGELPTYLIFQLLSLFTLSYLVLLVPFASYLAVIITLGRFYKDNEITAAEACGFGIPRIIKSAFYLSLMLAGCIAVLSMWIAPWAEAEQYNIRNKAAAESEFGFIAAGRFHEIRGGHGVFYVEQLDENSGKMKNVFIQLENDDGGLVVFSAQSGYLEFDKKLTSYFVVLENGYRIETLANKGYRTYEYEKSGVRIAQQEIATGTDNIVAQPTSELSSIGTPQSNAELQWRLSMPISSVLLVLMAVLLSRTSPRQGRFGSLFVALMVYIAYVYLLMLTKNGIAHGKIPVVIGMWWVHGLALAFVLWMMSRQFGKNWILAQFGFAKNTV